MRHYVLGTAGHIDHGKTSLIRALTGTDTDRLPEEKDRGMTIELGFAELVVDDVCFGVVDVPGHEKFVRTMVAGATGIDVALLVVAADDSVMPQTIEHVEILHLLGLSRAVVAVSKIDTVEPDMVALVEEEVRELLASTPLAAAPICPVSANTGAGLEALRRHLHALASEVPQRDTGQPFRLCVDRVFTVAGRGTVVTGSVVGGHVESGETLEVLPAGTTCRVRDVQSHGQAQAGVAGGQRAALNLSGMDRAEVTRGCELATPGYLKPTRMIDVRVMALAGAERPLRSTSTVRLGIGTRELPVRLVLADGEALLPGQQANAQLRAGESLVAAHGQRFILRDETGSRTIGGGVVLQPVVSAGRQLPAQQRAGWLEQLESAEPQERLLAALCFAGFTTPTTQQLATRTSLTVKEVESLQAASVRGKQLVTLPGTDAAFPPAVLGNLAGRVVRWLQRFHEENADQPGKPAEAVEGYLERLTDSALARPLVDWLVQAQYMRRLGRFICLPAFAPELSAADEKLMAQITQQLQEAAFQPPAPADLKLSPSPDKKRLQKLLSHLVALGEISKITVDLYLHADHERALGEAVAELIEAQGAVAVGQVRERLQSSRKYVVPLLEYLDRAGVTRREGDKRVLAE